MNLVGQRGKSYILLVLVLLEWSSGWWFGPHYGATLAVHHHQVAAVSYNSPRVNHTGRSDTRGSAGGSPGLTDTRRTPVKLAVWEAGVGPWASRCGRVGWQRERTGRTMRRGTARWLLGRFPRPGGSPSPGGRACVVVKPKAGPSWQKETACPPGLRWTGWRTDTCRHVVLKDARDASQMISVVISILVLLNHFWHLSLTNTFPFLSFFLRHPANAKC